MISLEEAQTLVSRHIPKLSSEIIPVCDASGRVLASSLRTPAALPRFDASAVDGYAIQSASTRDATPECPVRIPVVSTVRAGATSRVLCGPQRALRIFTGAAIPTGADAVVMQEHVVTSDGDIIISHRVKPGENVRRRGEEFEKGETVLSMGTLVTPPVEGLLASMGRSKVPVSRRPRVSLIVTGSELRSPAEPLRHGEIYDANLPAILSSLASHHVEVVHWQRAGDDADSLRQAMDEGLRAADVLITVGGVSVGDYDFVRDVCASLRIREIFWGVAIKPGKPSYFGVKGRKIVFGLPGNPVAALLTFGLFVDPALAGMSGRRPRQLLMTATLAEELRKKHGRLEFVRGMLMSDENGKLVVSPLRARGSHMLSGLAEANALIHLPLEESRFPAGSTVKVTLLRWSLS